jgi:hypothetical protein
MARRKSLREQAGLGKPIGKARRYPVNGSNETISYNEARRRIAALSDRQRNKVSLFERALGRTKNVETARRESGLSQRGLASYRKSFVASDRVSASPWQKEKGRWRFEPERLSYTHTFLDMRDGGRWLSAPFVGRELIVMQDWRAAAFGDAASNMAIPTGFRSRSGGSQAALDEWEKENPAGVAGADGQTYWPETDLASIKARLKRMSKRERKRIEESIRYKTKGKDQ